MVSCYLRMLPLYLFDLLNPHFRPADTTFHVLIKVPSFNQCTVFDFHIFCFPLSLQLLRSFFSAFLLKTDRFPPSSSSSTCLHHGRPVATVLLEPLLTSAATAPAYFRHGYHPLHTDNRLRPHEPFHPHAPTASGSPLHATAFDITNNSHTAVKHLSLLPTAATAAAPCGLTSNTTTEAPQAQSHSRGSTGTSSYSSISKSNHPRILALYGFLLGFQHHSRTSTPPSYAAYPMVPTRRDRRLADF